MIHNGKAYTRNTANMTIPDRIGQYDETSMENVGKNIKIINLTPRKTQWEKWNPTQKRQT